MIETPREADPEDELDKRLQLPTDTTEENCAFADSYLVPTANYFDSDFDNKNSAPTDEDGFLGYGTTGTASPTLAESVSLESNASDSGARLRTSGQHRSHKQVGGMSGRRSAGGGQKKNDPESKNDTRRRECVDPEPEDRGVDPTKEIPILRTAEEFDDYMRLCQYRPVEQADCRSGFESAVDRLVADLEERQTAAKVKLKLKTQPSTKSSLVLKVEGSEPPRKKQKVQFGGYSILTPSVLAAEEDSESYEKFKYRDAYIHPPMVRDIVNPLRLKCGEIIHYEMTVEDRDFLLKHKSELVNDSCDSEQGSNEENSELFDKFSLLIDLMEKLTGTKKAIPWEAASLVAQAHPNLGRYFSPWGIQLIHWHWLQRRTDTDKPLLRFLWQTSNPTASPAVAVFRPRPFGDRMSLRRSKRSAGAIAHKLLALDGDLKTIEDLMRKVVKRDQLRHLIAELHRCMFDQERHEVFDDEYVHPHWKFLLNSRYGQYVSSDLKINTKSWLDDLFPPVHNFEWSFNIPAADDSSPQCDTLFPQMFALSDPRPVHTTPYVQNVSPHSPKSLDSLEFEADKNNPAQTRSGGSDLAVITLPEHPKTLLFRARTGRCGRLWIDYKIPELDPNSKIIAPTVTNCGTQNRPVNAIASQENNIENVEDPLHRQAVESAKNMPTVRILESNHLPTYEPPVNDLNNFNNDNIISSKAHVLEQLRILYFLELITANGQGRPVLGDSTQPAQWTKGSQSRRSESSVAGSRTNSRISRPSNILAQDSQSLVREESVPVSRELFR